MKQAGWLWNQETQKYDLVMLDENGKVKIVPTDDKYPKWISYGTEGNENV